MNPRKTKFRFERYQHLYESISLIRARAKEAASELGLGNVTAGIGLYPGSSSFPGAVPKYVLDRVVEANALVTRPVRDFQKELRVLVKEVFGDDYEGVVLNTCESVLRVVNEVLFAPSTMGKGDSYRGRVLMPFNEDCEYLGAYGRPFPPRYKGMASDRSVSAGELSVEGKSLYQLDVLFARFVGARYEVHGIRSQVVPLLLNTDVDASIDQFRRLAERHAALLTGFQSIGYDTPSYGHAEKNARNAPRMLSETSKLAHEYGLPHFVDCGGGLPIIGYGPADVDADLMCWSMDKAGRTLACGLLVGREDVMLPIRRACGVAGQRFGETVSHGKSLYSFADPGRDALVSAVTYLRVLAERPELVTRPIDLFHRIIESELRQFKYKELLPGITLTKSYAFGGTELNYQRTWTDREFGIPISTIEDYFSDTNLIPIATEAMGVGAATVYAGNMFMTPGLGTLDEHGNLIEERAVLLAKALVKSMEIVCEVADVLR